MYCKRAGESRLSVVRNDSSITDRIDLLYIHLHNSVNMIFMMGELIFLSLPLNISKGTIFKNNIQFYFQPPYLKVCKVFIFFFIFHSKQILHGLMQQHVKNKFSLDNQSSIKTI